MCRSRPSPKCPRPALSSPSEGQQTCVSVADLGRRSQPLWDARWRCIAGEPTAGVSAPEMVLTMSGEGSHGSGHYAFAISGKLSRNLSPARPGGSSSTFANPSTAALRINRVRGRLTATSRTGCRPVASNLTIKDYHGRLPVLVRPLQPQDRWFADDLHAALGRQRLSGRDVRHSCSPATRPGGPMRHRYRGLIVAAEVVATVAAGGGLTAWAGWSAGEAAPARPRDRVACPCGATASRDPGEISEDRLGRRATLGRRARSLTGTS